MTNPILLSKVLYKQINLKSDVYSHNQFTTTDNVKIDQKKLLGLGLALPIYCNPNDKSIYSGIPVNPNLIDYKNSLTQELVKQADFLVAKPWDLYLSKATSKNRISDIFITTDSNLYNLLSMEFSKLNLPFINNPGIYTTLSKLKFHDERARRGIIASCHSEFENLLPTNLGQVTTLLAPAISPYSNHVSHALGDNTYFLISSPINWVIRNFKVENIKEDEFEKIFTTYNKILTALENLISIASDSKISLFIVKDGVCTQPFNNQFLNEFMARNKLIRSDLGIDRQVLLKIEAHWKKYAPIKLIQKLDLNEFMPI